MVGMRGTVARAKTGNLSASMSVASRVAPSITTAVTPTPRAQVLKYSPQTARDVQPRVSITRTSPGRVLVRAAEIIRKSPGGVVTVTAGPTIRGTPENIGR